jgi:hypothetical protein
MKPFFIIFVFCCGLSHAADVLDHPCRTTVPAKENFSTGFVSSLTLLFNSENSKINHNLLIKSVNTFSMLASGLNFTTTNMLLMAIASHIVMDGEALSMFSMWIDPLF